MLIKRRVTVFEEYLLTYFSFFFFITSFLPLKQILYSTFFLVLFLLFIKNKYKVDRVLIIILITYSILIIFQSVIFERFSYKSFIGVMILLLYPYFALRIIGIRYLEISINIIYMITIISFLFFIPSILIPGFYEMLARFAYNLNLSDALGGQNFIIYTVKGLSAWSRNSGNFPEPGSFASYLCFALVFNLLLSGEKLVSKKNIVFIAGILTTQSTAGYLALGYILVFYFAFLAKNKLKYIYVVIAVILSIFLYENLNFLQKKITTSYEQGIEEDRTEGRFGSFYYNLNEIRSNPYLLLYGRGILKATRFDEVETWEGDQAPVQNLNSFSNLLVQVGGIGFIILFYFWIKSYIKIVHWKGYKKYVALLPIVVFIIVLSSQQALSNPLFWSFFYLSSISEQKRLLYKGFKNKWVLTPTRPL